MQCAGKSAQSGLNYMAFHLDDQAGVLELLCCTERACVLYECPRGAPPVVVTSLPIGTALAERSRQHHRLAVVGSGDRPDFNPRRVVILDTANNNNVVASLVFPTVVLGLCFSVSRSRLAVCTETAVHVYDSDQGSWSGTHHTRLNPAAVFSLSADGKRLAYPLTDTVVGIADAQQQLLTLDVGVPFGSLKLNRGGDKLAVASQDGKCCWVFSIDLSNRETTWQSTKLFQLLRGHSEAVIEGLCFNSDSTLLAVAGNSGTVHVFELSESRRFSSSGLASYLTSAWHRSTLKIALDKHSSVSCIASIMLHSLERGMPNIVDDRRICVATADGAFLEYAFGADQELAVDSNGVLQQKPKKYIVYTQNR